MSEPEAEVTGTPYTLDVEPEPEPVPDSPETPDSPSGEIPFKSELPPIVTPPPFAPDESKIPDEVKPTSKFRSIPMELIDPHGVLNKPPVLPGMDGKPFRGSIPQLRENDVRRPTAASEVRIEVLRLDHEEDLAHYEKISQLCNNGMATMGTEERVYDDSIKSWRVLVRWAYDYTYLPASRHKQ